MLWEWLAGAGCAFLLALVTTPAGVSGAVLLLPIQVSVLGVPSPAVTPTNLLYNVIATPGGLYRYGRQQRAGGPQFLRLATPIPLSESDIGSRPHEFSCAAPGCLEARRRARSDLGRGRSLPCRSSDFHTRSTPPTHGLGTVLDGPCRESWRPARAARWFAAADLRGNRCLDLC